MHSWIRAVAPLCVCLLLAAPGRAQESAKALEIVKDAIRAHGGFLAMNRAQLIQRSGSGSINAFGQETPFSDELLADLPQRFRSTVEIGPAGQRSRMIVCLDGDKGWQSTGANSAELGKERLDELREEVHV